MVYILKLTPYGGNAVYVASFNPDRSNPFEFGDEGRALCFVHNAEHDHEALLREWANQNSYSTAPIAKHYNKTTNEMDELLSI